MKSLCLVSLRPEPPPHKVGVRPVGLRTRLRASPSLSTPLLCFFSQAAK